LGLTGLLGLANFSDRTDWPFIGVTPNLLWNEVDEALYVGITGIENWVQISSGSLQGVQGEPGATGVAGFTGFQGQTGTGGLSQAQILSMISIGF